VNGTHIRSRWLTRGGNHGSALHELFFRRLHCAFLQLVDEERIQLLEKQVNHRNTITAHMSLAYVFKNTDHG
jgi:hypothetical protein